MRSVFAFVVVLFLVLVLAANLRCVPPAGQALALLEWGGLLGSLCFVLAVVFVARWLHRRALRRRGLTLEVPGRSRRYGL